MRTQNTHAGRVTLITLSKFLSLLNVNKVDPKMQSVQFNTLISYETNFPDGEDSIYHRNETYLVEGDRKAILKAGLLYQAMGSHAYLEKGGYQDNFETLCITHLERFGLPEYLVRVAPRRWMVAQLEDFKIYDNGRGVALACYNRSRTVICGIDRVTQDKAKEFLDQYIEASKGLVSDGIDVDVKTLVSDKEE